MKPAINIGIDEPARIEIADGLARLLADTYMQFAKLMSMREESSVPDANQMVAQLVEGQELVVRTARSVFPVAEAANDEPTVDLLTQRMQVHEKTAWMLRSMIS